MKRKVLALAMAAVMMVGLFVGCGSSSSKEESAGSSAAQTESTASAAPAETEGGKEYKIGICNINDSDENCFLACDTMRQICESDEFKEAVGADSIVVEWANSDGDIDKQTSNIETLLVKDIDVLFMIGVSTSGSSVAVKSCNDAGVPVFMVATESEEGEWKFVGFDEYQCGYQQGKYLAENTEGEVNVCYLTGIPGQTNVIQRKDGFVKAIEDAGRTDIKIIAEQAGNFLAEDAMQITEDWLQAYGDEIDWIVTQDNKMGQGAVEVLKAANKVGEIKVNSWIVSGTWDAELVKEGYVDYAVYVNFKTLGETMADVCMKQLNGEEVPDTNYMELFDITTENVNEYFE